jgi:hypothetical protein
MLSTFAQFIELFPPGRTRARYERLASELGGQAITLTVPQWDQPLWLVADAVAARALVIRGIRRSQVWTLREVQDLVGAFGRPPRSLLEAALAMGEIPARQPNITGPKDD